MSSENSDRSDGSDDTSSESEPGDHFYLDPLVTNSSSVSSDSSDVSDFSELEGTEDDLFIRSVRTDW